MIAPRRDFLRGLVSLPLIGGSVALIGQPTAVAETASQGLLLNYQSWLFYEHRMVSYELANHDLVLSRELRRYVTSNSGAEWHFQWSKPGTRGPAGWDDAPQPSSRAALVLSAVGCDWREEDQ